MDDTLGPAMRQDWTHHSLPQRLRFGAGAVAELGKALERADAIVSLGGGSSADLSKAVSLFAPGDADLDDDVERPAVLPYVAVPTTYAGAELMPFFGMLDEDARRKRGVQRYDVAPHEVLYDPRLTLTMPRNVSAQTGMNVLAHCVEIAYSPEHTLETEAVALAGTTRIAASLPRVVDAPDDLGARTEMLAGAALGGRPLQNGRMGVHHGLAQLVGARAGIPHGLAKAVLLPHVMHFNADAVPDALAATDAVAALLVRLGLPTRLSDCGVSDDGLQAVGAKCGRNRNVASTPKPVEPDAALALVREAW
jgi:maleylacetate reductase